jgi:murein DD-endopeptidase MepM/ murein hydrolase activator NlpD
MEVLVLKRALTVFLIVVMATALILPVSADTLQEYYQRSNNIKSEIDQKLQIKKNTEKEKSYLEQIKESLDLEETKQQQIEQKMQSDLQSIEEVAQSIDEQLEALKMEYSQSLEKLKKRLKVMYENSMVSMLDLLFQSKNLMDFFERIDLMRAMAKANKALIERMKVIKRDIEFKSALKNQQIAIIGDMIIEQGERIEQIRTDRSDLEEDIRGKSMELRDLERQIDELNRKSQEITEYIKKLQSQQKYVGGEMAWPLPSCNTVGSQFGMRLHPILRVYKMHTGIDIGGTHGASIVAANDGTVIYAGWQNGYGYTVIIDHGTKDGVGITTLYAHCSKLAVKYGQVVKKGDIIANVGQTGLATGPHLHFEVRENGEPVNPINNKYLKKN